MKYILVISAFLVSMGSQAQKIPQKDYIKQLQDTYVSGHFRADDDATILVAMDDPAIRGSENVLYYLEGRIPGWNVLKTTSGGLSVRYRSGAPAFFLDEIRVDAATLAAVNVNDIAFVKMFRSYFVGAPGSTGALAVYTRKGEEEEREDQ